MSKTDNPSEPPSEYHEYVAWDVPTRLFHWINALAVLGLIATGVGILTGNLLGLSPEGKIALKSAHAVLGYVMAANLLWRFVWAFFGNRYARWRSILPGGAGFVGALRAYVASFLTGEPQQYIGHNPLARIGDLHKIKRVVANGRLYEMNQLISGGGAPKLTTER